MMHYESCPFCGSAQLTAFITVKDHTVSQREFTICRCNECTGAFTQNVPSQDDIGAFYASENYISHSDTQEGIINKLYHQVRKRTLQQKLHLVNRVTGITCGKILDVGCGTGAFLHTMQQAGWKITGLEPDGTARQKAAELYTINPLPPGELYNFSADSFDAITLWHVLEHVHDLHEYLDQLKKLLKPNGKLIIAVPNYTSKDAKHYGRFWAAYDVPRHLYHFSPKCMRLLMQDHGLQVISTKPMWFDSFYVSMLSEQYKNGVSNLPAAFFAGISSNLSALGDKEKCSSLIYIIGKG